jgi:hypothetical protein
LAILTNFKEILASLIPIIHLNWFINHVLPVQ